MNGGEHNWLNDLPAFDWSDFETASTRAADVLARLADDKALLGALTANVLTDPALSALCECHDLDDKIVIYDGLADRNFRIRWRLANSETEYERAHTHRFSFVTHVLSGAHHETLYTVGAKAEDDVELADLTPLIAKDIVERQSFAIHHSTIHSTTTDKGTIGLLLRGVAEKKRAFIVRMSDAERWYRYGAADEAEERRQLVQMRPEVLSGWISELSERGIIERDNQVKAG